MHVKTFAGGAVLVIRNPYRAIISFWNWEKTQNNTGLASQLSFCSPEFREFVFNAVSRWCELIEDWVNWATKLKIVFFEDLSTNPIEETRQILYHLNIPVDESRLRCLSQHQEGQFHRRKTKPVNPFSSEHRAVTAWAVERVSRLLREKRDLNTPRYQVEEGAAPLECPPK